jgi:hypothetical protein
MKPKKWPTRRKPADLNAELISRKLQQVLRTKNIRIPKSGFLLRTARGRVTVEAVLAADAGSPSHATRHSGIHTLWFLRALPSPTPSVEERRAAGDPS